MSGRVVGQVALAVTVYVALLGVSSVLLAFALTARLAGTSDDGQSFAGIAFFGVLLAIAGVILTIVADNVFHPRPVGWSVRIAAVAAAAFFVYVLVQPLTAFYEPMCCDAWSFLPLGLLLAPVVAVVTIVVARRG